jgi:betaine-aldehyde dehydrogenase
MSALEDRTDCVFVGGSFRAGAGPVREAINPANEDVFATFQMATSEDVGQACAQAAASFSNWRTTPVDIRAKMLRGFADGLLARKAALVTLQMRNNGKPRQEAEFDVEDARACFNYYADLIESGALNRPDQMLPEGMTGRQTLVPYGPAALIVPWNFPLVTTAWKLAPALAAGCTAVLKPSEFTTLAELVYGDIAQEIGLPEGVLSILPGLGDIGAAMIAAHEIRKVSFTGSTETGSKVMAAAATRVLPVSLELGGKAPIVVLQDADIAQAAEIALAGILFNAGQMCSATARLIVAQAVADDLIAELRARLAKLRVGDPLSAEVDMGPVTTLPQRDKVQSYLRAARTEGLDCLAGGADGHGAGYFVEPTIYVDVPEDSRLWIEEIFGPVLCIRRVSSDEEAIRLANATEYGLVATVVGGERAQQIADRIEAGHIWVNVPQIIFPETSWGGFKASGIGRELGDSGLKSYCAVKHITSGGL